MAVITSATTGLYGTGATWVGGVAPVEGDSVVIACTSTGLETFSTDATGYIVGSTVIILTGTVLAGSYVVGETVQFGSTDPNYYTITAWVSATKTLTISPLIVAIPAVATVVKCRGHKVTVDGTYTGGDDTATAFTVNGTLFASRTVNNTLIVKGLIQTAATVSATIDRGRNSLSDPIPTGITSRLTLNKSAAMANYKYGLFVADSSNFYSGGVARTRNTTTTASLAASGTSVTVADATNWAVNDWVVFAETTGTTTQYDRRQIATITPGAGTTATITFTAVTFAHASGCPVGNFTSNVIIDNFNTTNPAYICFRSSTLANNRREVNNTTFEYVGSDTSNTAARVFISSSTLATTTPFLSFSGNSFYNGNNTTALFISAINSTTPLSNLAFFTDAGLSGAQSYAANGSSMTIDNSVYYYNAGPCHQSAFSQAGQSFTISNSKLWASGSHNCSHQNGDGASYTNCQFHSSAAGVGLCGASSGTTYYTNCSIGSSDLPGTTSFGYFAANILGGASTGSHLLTNCKFGSPTLAGLLNQSITGNLWNLYVVNKNQSVIAQEYYTNAGLMVRDNSTFNRSPSSEKFAPQTASRAFARTYTVPAPNNTARRVIGYLRYDANYTNVTPPSVTLSGLGITPVTYTAGASVNTWYQFDLSATQTSGADGNLTLTVTGQSTATTGFYWLDGIVDAPFITTSRHYGFIFDSLIYRTVNSVIQQTNEATVGAYTGIAINHGTQTITVTSNHTAREIYDYCYYNLCQTANLSQAEFFTSTDGINFTSTYNMTLNGGNITGTGTINLGSKVLTRAGSESSTLPITYNSGAAALVNVAVSGLISNSKIRIYNTTDSTVVYDGASGGVSYSAPLIWTANKTLTLTVESVSGATAYQTFNQSSTLTITGCTFVANQLPDTIYNSNAVDGSTITEWSADTTNIRLNATADTTFQRMYAFYVYAKSNDANGRAKLSNVIIAQDTVNYLVNTAYGSLKLSDPTAATVYRVSGAYMYRDDGANLVYATGATGVLILDMGKGYTANSTNIFADLAVINTGVQKASKFIPHSADLPY